MRVRKKFQNNRRRNFKHRIFFQVKQMVDNNYTAQFNLISASNLSPASVSKPKERTHLSQMRTKDTRKQKVADNTSILISPARKEMTSSTSKGANSNKKRMKNILELSTALIIIQEAVSRLNPEKEAGENHRISFQEKKWMRYFG